MYNAVQNKVANKIAKFCCDIGYTCIICSFREKTNFIKFTFVVINGKKIIGEVILRLLACCAGAGPLGAAASNCPPPSYATVVSTSHVVRENVSSSGRIKMDVVMSTSFTSSVGYHQQQ